MQPHGERGYDAPKARGGLGRDAFAEDVALGGEDGGRRVVAARLDAKNEAAPRLLAAEAASSAMAGESSCTMPQEDVGPHYYLL